MDYRHKPTQGVTIARRCRVNIQSRLTYWLMLTVRDAIPKPQPLALAEFATLRARLLKIAARITETASRVRIAFAAACPEANLFRSVALGLQPAAP